VQTIKWYQRQSGVWVAVKENIADKDKLYNLCKDCLYFKPGKKSNCPIAEEVFKYDIKNHMATPVLECPAFIPKPGVDQDKFVRYKHHGEVVAVRKFIKGKHREFCLCHVCEKFFPNQQKNCLKAQTLYKIDLKYHLVTPVFECPVFLPQKD